MLNALFKTDSCSQFNQKIRIAKMTTWQRHLAKREWANRVRMLRYRASRRRTRSEPVLA